MAKWKGPVTVIEKLRPYSYMIELEDGSRRAVHANKLRSCHTRVTAVGVIFEGDQEFGDVPVIPSRTQVQATLHPDDIAHLECVQQKQLRDLITRHSRVFANKPGTCRVGVHRIKIKAGEQPRRAYPYRVPMALVHEVERQVDELRDWGLIYPVESPHAYPLVCVSKKDGGIRICCDYRKLNEITEADAFPMSVPTDLLYQVANAKYITLLDMFRGYWQIPLDEDAQLCTAFTAPSGQYAWKVMPFGLKNAASTYQRVINGILAPHRQYACAYIDDVAIYSESWEEHLEHLDKVLSSLDKAGLTLNVSKCRFAQQEVKFLGHIVGSGRHGTDPEKVRAIKEIPAPETKRQLRSFLGLANYYRDYVPEYSKVVLPLTNLTGRRIPQKLPWDTQAQEAFDQVKDCLVQASALQAPDPGKEFILATDASDYAIGACLAQQDNEGKECPIAFLSKKLSPAQTRWATIEKEAYAIIWALSKLEAWLFGARVRVITDHNPLKFLTLTTPQSARLTRWALALQKYNLVVEHKKGLLNANADAMSRLVTSNDDA